MSTRTTTPVAIGAPPTAARAGAGRAAAFTGTWALVRLAVRRDRFLIPLWILLFVVMASSSASATAALYPDVASRVAAAETVNSATSLRALYGPIWDVTSLGQIALFKLSALGAALVAVLSLILVVRHTRGEEEEGRLELLGAGVLGRLAPLTAALVVVIGTNLLLAVLTWSGLAAAGLPVVGSLAFGLSWAVTGISFAAVAAIAAQLTTGARAAKGLAAAVLGATYILRALGDTAGAGGPTWLSWLSPVGWAQQVRAFGANRWWVLVIGAVFAALAASIAYALQARRDLGAGLLADRPGPGRASRLLGSPAGLALRLQRGVLLAWTAAYVILGAVLGNLASSVGGFLDTPQAREFIVRLGGEKGLIDAFFATEMSFVGVITSVFAIQSLLRLRGEETGRRAEPVLATAVGRRQWVASHLAISVLGSLWLLALGGAVAGALHAANSGDASQFGRILGAALAQMPAVLVMIGLTLVAFGLVPRLAAFGWAALVVFLVIGELGPLFELDQRVMDISPFTHVPKLPGVAFTATPLIWLSVLALALLVAGIEGFRRRDLD